MNKRFFLLVIYFAALLGLIPTVITWNNGSSRDVLTKQSPIYALFGAFFGCCFVLIHKLVVRHRVRRYRSSLQLADVENLDPNDLRQSLVMPCGFNQAIQLCIDSVSSLSGARITANDSSVGLISLRTSISYGSLAGELIDFNLKRVGERCTELEIHGQPVLKRPWFNYCNYGRTIDNVRTICEYLRGRTNVVLIGTQANQI